MFDRIARWQPDQDAAVAARAVAALALAALAVHERRESRRPPILQRLAILAEHRRGTPSAG